MPKTKMHKVCQVLEDLAGRSPSQLEPDVSDQKCTGIFLRMMPNIVGNF
jgi:hypothetical protein